MRLGLEGAGRITHIWVTMMGDDPHMLRTTSIRMWWDGEAEPSVDAPIGEAIEDRTVYREEHTAQISPNASCSAVC